jgi:hypothetical protein
MKYFTIPTIKAALENLQPIDNKWFIIPLVLAANGVTVANKVETRRSKGTGKFLKNFFDGTSIGLGPREHGKSCNIRPGNSDPRSPNDQLIHVDYSDLWGKTYSQSGYAKWQNGAILQSPGPGDSGFFQLGPNFSTEFRKQIAITFKFESLLVWVYAFKGVPDTVNSWADLLQTFNSEFMSPLAGVTPATAGIPSEYQSVFCLTAGEAWPGTQPDRPTNEEFHNEFLPHLTSVQLKPSSLAQLRDVLKGHILTGYIGLDDAQAKDQADAVVAALESCRRLFLYGEPGIGKTELAQLIGTAFKEVFEDRAHVLVAPIADSTTSDKLVGFSTLDGSWVPGILTQEHGKPKKKLLYDENNTGEALAGRRQVNVLILDEANRRDIEDLLVKFQNALDSDSSEPEHDDFRIALDNAGELRMAPNTYVLMTGNSPRDDSGRVVQSRPFKRRHNFLPLENLFRNELLKPPADFSATIQKLWKKVGPLLRIEQVSLTNFEAELIAVGNAPQIAALQTVLLVLDSYAIGVSFGLTKKLLKTTAMRFALGGSFKDSLDKSLAESVFPLLTGEEPIDGKSLRDSLQALDPAAKTSFLTFFQRVESILRGADLLGRVKPFL